MLIYEAKIRDVTLASVNNPKPGYDAIFVGTGVATLLETSYKNFGKKRVGVRKRRKALWAGNL